MLWDNIAAGGMAISYTMGRQDKLSLRKPVEAIGARTLKLPVAGFGTVGIGGVDAVVSSGVAKSLGLPADNAVIVSAPQRQARRPDEADQAGHAGPYCGRGTGDSGNRR